MHASLRIRKGWQPWKEGDRIWHVLLPPDPPSSHRLPTLTAYFQAAVATPDPSTVHDVSVAYPVTGWKDAG